MGKMEFYAWIDQVWREAEEESKPADSWAATRNDPGWQSMRARRDQELGRR